MVGDGEPTYFFGARGPSLGPVGTMTSKSVTLIFPRSSKPLNRGSGAIVSAGLKVQRISLMDMAAACSINLAAQYSA